MRIREMINTFFRVKREEGRGKTTSANKGREGFTLHPSPFTLLSFPVSLLCLMGVLGCFSSMAIATPQIQTWQTPTGAKVLFVENHDLPMLDVSVKFPAGSGYDQPTQIGVANLSNQLLKAGTLTLSEDDIARQMADIGAQFSTVSSKDSAGLVLRTLSYATQREQAIAMLAAMLLQPAFPADILAREKARAIAALKEDNTKPETLANKAFAKAIYGSHPYGFEETPAGLDNITVAMVQHFYRRHYAARFAVIAMMGDVSRAQAEVIATQLTAQLPISNEAIALPTATAITVSELRISHPATQSHLLIGAPAIARNDPDYYALYVGNYILGGGGFVSRLMNEVREKRGLAYSVYSYFMPLKQTGAFEIGLQTKKEQADQALQIVRTVFADFMQHGVTDKELRAAKQNIINGFPLRIDSNRKILEVLSTIGLYDLPLTYLDDFQQHIDSVTAAEIHAAFARHLNPNAMATVIVGAPDSP